MIRIKAKLAPFMLSRKPVERSKHERDKTSISPTLSTSLRAGFDRS
jgi:hypothetical protein